MITVTIDPLAGPSGLNIADVTFGLPPNTFQKKCLILPISVAADADLPAGSINVVLSLYRRPVPLALVRASAYSVDYPAGKAIIDHPATTSLTDGKLLINLSDIPMADVHTPELYRLFVEVDGAESVCVDFVRINSGVQGGPSTVLVPDARPPISIKPPPQAITSLGQFGGWAPGL